MSRQVIPVPVYQKQADFLHATEWCVGFVAGRGAGKSRIGAHKVIRSAKANDPWMTVSPDAGVVTETTFPTFVELAKELGVYVKEKLSPYPKVWWRTADGGTANIIFRSGEKPKKLHGPNKAGLWIDEASLQHHDVFMDAIPTLRWKGGMGPVLLTFTPKGKANWTFSTFFDQVGDDDLDAIDESDPSIYWFSGRPYRLKHNARLIHASSRENPFLPDEFYDTLRSNMSQQLAQQELEGDFIEVAGLMFQRAWFKMVDSAPRDALRVRYWDRASTAGSGSYTAGALIARCPRGMTYIEDVVRGQWSYHERDAVIEQVAEQDARKYQGEVVIIAEQEGGSGGKEVMHQMMTKLGRFPIQRDIVGGKQHRFENGITFPGQAKVTRAMPLSGQAEAGNVYIVRGKFNDDLLDELTSFPESRHADQVDAVSGGYNRLAGKMFAPMQPAKKDSVAVNTGERFGALAALDQVRKKHRLFGMQERRR